MSRFGALALAFLLAGCGDFIGSPHGYWFVGSGSVTGISIGIDPTTGGPSLTLGNKTGRFAFGPALDGEGQAIPPLGIFACFQTNAGVTEGAAIGDTIAIAGADSKVSC